MRDTREVQLSTTRAQAEVLEQTAGRFEQVNESLQGMLHRLMAQLEMLRTQWQGAGGRSFEQARQAWGSEQAALQRALLETAGALRTAGRRYEATDTHAAERFVSASRPAIDLPL